MRNSVISAPSRRLLTGLYRSSSRRRRCPTTFQQPSASGVASTLPTCGLPEVAPYSLLLPSAAAHQQPNALHARRADRHASRHRPDATGTALGRTVPGERKPCEGKQSCPECAVPTRTGPGRHPPRDGDFFWSDGRSRARDHAPHRHQAGEPLDQEARHVQPAPATTAATAVTARASCRWRGSSRSPTRRPPSAAGRSRISWRKLKPGDAVRRQRPRRDLRRLEEQEEAPLLGARRVHVGQARAAHASRRSSAATRPCATRASRSRERRARQAKPRAHASAGRRRP